MRGGLAVAAAALLLSGCAAEHEPRGLLGKLWHFEVGADYRRPQIEAPAQFRSQVSASEAESFADLPWWEVFSDAELRHVIGEALSNNYDLQAATARVEQARALVGVAASPLFPQAGYDVDAAREKRFIPGERSNVTSNAFRGILNAAWEIDVWGRIRRTTEAARADLFAREDARRGILLTLASDTAAGYFQLIELDRELEIARESAGAYQKTLDLFTQRYHFGTDTKISVARATAAVAASEAATAALERQIVQQENALSVLLGANPGAIPRGQPLTAQAMPQAPPGSTTALVERRPDILQAEHAMVEANAEVGVAVANFFPTIGLSALYGASSSHISDVVKRSFSVWGVAAQMSGPIFQGGRLLDSYYAQKAFWDEAIARYKGTIVEAFREVSDALTAEQKLVVQRAALERQVGALRDAVNLSLLRYNTGLANYFEVLEAQQQLYPAQDALAQTQRDQLIAVVNLYKALGGGWKLADTEWAHGP